MKLAISACLGLGLFAFRVAMANEAPADLAELLADNPFLPPALRDDGAAGGAPAAARVAGNDP